METIYMELKIKVKVLYTKQKQSKSKVNIIEVLEQDSLKPVKLTSTLLDSIKDKIKKWEPVISD